MKKNMILPLVLIWQFSSIAFSSDEIKTQYPFVLIHGLLGFSGELPFGLTYWGDIPDFLKENGATVLMADLSAANDVEVRGEQLHEQLMEWGHIKYHLIGHSQGGLEARYVLNKNPDLVASITTIGTPHRGSPVADAIYGVVESTPVVSRLMWRCADMIGCCIGVVSHHYDDVKNEAKELTAQICQVSHEIVASINIKSILGTAIRCFSKTTIVDTLKKAKDSVPTFFGSLRKACGRLCHGAHAVYCQLQRQDAKKAIYCLTTKALKEFNRIYSQGIGSESSQHKLFSCGTHAVKRNGICDLVGTTMQCLSFLFFDEETNDGIVDLRSMQFGTWLGEARGPHHFVVANNGLGSFRKEDINWLRELFLALARYLEEDL